MANTHKRNHGMTIRTVTATVLVAITLSLVAAVLPNVAAEAATTEDVFRNRLVAVDATEKFAPMAEAAVPAAAHARTETYVAPPAPARTARRSSTSGSSASAGSAPSGGGDLTSILAGYIARYPILAGTTISYGDAKGYQAISYYKSGRIVVSSTHTASLQRIIGHEIWHVIDWRDNGVIDWGENVPPR